MTTLKQLQQEVKSELTQNILPYWINKITDVSGGFYGRMDGKENLHKEAGRGAVMNARILWTFSSAYRLFGNKEYLTAAQNAFTYFINNFIDRKYGGVFWELDSKGKPINTRKQMYAQGFAIYGLSEYYRATGLQQSLEEAVKIFNCIEKYALDTQYGGYIEALDRQWQTLEDMRLSEKDDNAPKSMNTHLHLLEPYTNLLRVWKDEQLKKAHKKLIDIFCNHIISNKTYHQYLFFDKAWNPLSCTISYGHDIECAWLLYEAAQVQGNAEDIALVAVSIADAAIEGLQKDGSMIYEKTNAHTVLDRHWWVQAETVVGFYYAYKISGSSKYLEYATCAWNYIKTHVIDKTNGEWFWSISPEGTANTSEDKAGFWKCPYHNGRMCMEML
ncbi:MAG: AGE family epimerase/isomerase [Bacteroidales bacterium]|jgi:mannobiose 2-epimerase|nr:AGE family epimerase/isomerase [Bacteroidales bacterium]